MSPTRKSVSSLFVEFGLFLTSRKTGEWRLTNEVPGYVRGIPTTLESNIEEIHCE